jgi:hypothetical protein
LLGINGFRALWLSCKGLGSLIESQGMSGDLKSAEKALDAILARVNLPIPVPGLEAVKLSYDDGEVKAEIVSAEKMAAPAKPKRGRPFKPLAERKSVYIGVRLTKASAEWLELERQAHGLGTLGQVVRQLIAERIERSKLEALSIE